MSLTVLTVKILRGFKNLIRSKEDGVCSRPKFRECAYV